MSFKGGWNPHLSCYANSGHCNDSHKPWRGQSVYSFKGDCRFFATDDCSEPKLGELSVESKGECAFLPNNLGNINSFKCY